MIIKHRKDVDLEITVDNTVGLSFDSSQIEVSLMKAVFGSNNKMTIRVQHKA